MILGMAHVGLIVRDVEKSKRFYEEILGFSLAAEGPAPDGTLIAIMRKNDCSIELVEIPQYGGFSDGYFNHLALLVDDIKISAEELKKKGVIFSTEDPIERYNVFNGVKFMMFRGPDNEYLEIDELL